MQLLCYQTRGGWVLGNLSQIITKICFGKSVTNHYKNLFVSNSPDKSNQLCLCKYNKECGVESVIYSAIWFRSNLFYSALFGRISVNFFGSPDPINPWVTSSWNAPCGSGSHIWTFVSASMVTFLSLRLVSLCSWQKGGLSSQQIAKLYLNAAPPLPHMSVLNRAYLS